jgi:hypothetical protein
MEIGIFHPTRVWFLLKFGWWVLSTTLFFSSHNLYKHFVSFGQINGKEKSLQNTEKE